MASELDPLFAPRSIAVVGASSNSAKRGNQSIQALLAGGFQGKIFPINPNGQEILGLKTYRAIADIPRDVDLALICTPANTLVSIIEECGRKGVKGAVVLAGGFGESGSEGKMLERQVFEAAKKTNVRLIGPNTSGVFNLHHKMNLVGFSNVRPGGIGILSQSGNMALALVTEGGQSSPIGFSSYVGVGNQIDLSLEDYLDYFAEDPNTAVVAAYIEGFKDGHRFLQAATRFSLKKPLVVYKSGRTTTGQRAALSHTGSLAQSFRLTSDLLRQCGVVVTTRTDDLLTIADILARCPIKSVRRVAILADGGGHATIAADELSENGLLVAELSAETQERLREFLPASATFTNPIDLAGAADGSPGVFAECAEVLLTDQNVDALLIVGLFGGYAIRFAKKLLEDEISTARKIPELSRRTGKPVVLHTLYATSNTEPLTQAREGGLAIARTVESAVAGLVAISDYHSFLQRRAKPADDSSSGDIAGVITAAQSAIAAGQRIILEPQARRILRENGIAIEPEVVLRSPEDSDLVSGVFGRSTLALKIVSPDILHKSEARGVKLNVRCEDVVAGYSELVRNAYAYNPQARIDGVLVTAMARPGLEVIVGVMNDRSFGRVIMVGLGGIFVEVLKDTQFRMLPIDRSDGFDMLRRLEASKILEGIRGGEKVDQDALVDLLVKLSRFAEAHPKITEIDLNPVIVRSDGYTIVDARMIIE
jgi:acyl-CoA synthetase (NDP forming)